MPTAKFLEAGTAATQGLEFWPSTTVTNGTIASDSAGVGGSTRSINCTSTTASGKAFANYGSFYVPAIRGRSSFYYRTTRIPAGTLSNSIQAGLGGGCELALNTAAHLILLASDEATVLATGTATLAINTDYRISTAFSKTSQTVNTFEVYVNGVLDFSATNVDVQSGVGNATLRLGRNIAANNIGTGTDYFAHFYTDELTTGDPGNILVTAKRPLTNGTVNGYTASGTASSYGTGNAAYVNERPLSQTNLVAVVNAGTVVTEEYNIEGRSVGDIDLTSKSIVDYVGWVYTKALSAETGRMVLNGNSYAISITTSAAMFSQPAGSTLYPAGTGTDIGEITDTTATTVTLYECGIQFAYLATGGVVSGSGSGGAINPQSLEKIFMYTSPVSGGAGGTTPTAALAPSNSTTTAYASSLVIKATPGILRGISGHNSSSNAQFIQVHNTTTVPADGAIPTIVYYVPASTSFSFDFLDWGENGRFFDTGIVVCNSSTARPKTIGQADCWWDAQYI